MDSSIGIPATLKWGKQNLRGLRLHPGSSGDALQQEIYALTGVPVERQKLMCRDAWKGTLKSEDLINGTLSLASGQTELVVTLIGSVQSVPALPQVGTKFVEDLSNEEVEAAEIAARLVAFEAAEGMIVALQKLPVERDDHKMETYKYNSLVTGLPQRQIEDGLKRRRKCTMLLGECAMTMGQELGRAYVTSLSVLHDGTLVSGMENGSVKLWRHGAQVHHGIHDVPEVLQRAGISGCGVACICPVAPSLKHDIAFATGGNGLIKFWTVEAKCVHSLMGPIFPGPGESVMHTTPVCLGALQFGEEKNYLVTTFREGRSLNSSAFHLVPQNDAERQRRLQAEAADAALRRQLSNLARQVQGWSLEKGQSSECVLKSLVLEPSDGTATARLTTLVVCSCCSGTKVSVLICGDAMGGLRIWGKRDEDCSRHDFEQLALLQIRCEQDRSNVASVVCIVPLVGSNQLLAVSTDAATAQIHPEHQTRNLHGSLPVYVRSPRTVLIVHIEEKYTVMELYAHNDVVHCMCPTPDGGLVTCGGKLDGTVQVWSKLRWSVSQRVHFNADTKEHKSQPLVSSDVVESALPLVSAEATILPSVITECDAKLTDIGYSFAVTILPDTKPGSELYALAAARYNVVKICL